MNNNYFSIFKQAQAIPRKFIAILGEPNSGKTHEAMEELSRSKSGVYLAPLRLLALENYERLSGKGLLCNMVTGEERKLVSNATHVVSTIEMADFKTPRDVAVIDEVQMLDDKERGSAWTAAICGIPAQTVYLIGSVTSEKALRRLATILGTPIEFVFKKRLSPLKISPTPLGGLKNLRAGDALICFSRKDVLFFRDEVTSLGFSTSTIYGNLSPEVRTSQATLFRKRQSEVLIGTDALAMGLNLPIDRVIFTRMTKFNGIGEINLPLPLIHQIGGRAGRFGISELGMVMGLDKKSHIKVIESLNSELPEIDSKKFLVSPRIEDISEISSSRKISSLARCLDFFIKESSKSKSCFEAAVTSEQIYKAELCDKHKLSLDQKFTLSLAPVNVNNRAMMDYFNYWVQSVAQNRQVKAPRFNSIINPKTLFDIENACKIQSCYSWLAMRMPQVFPELELSNELKSELGSKIESFLRKSNSKRSKDSVWSEIDSMY